MLLLIDNGGMNPPQAKAWGIGLGVTDGYICFS